MRLASMTLLVALLLAAPVAAEPRSEGGPSPMRVWILRLGPGQDLRAELEAFARAKGLRAGFVVSAVGSLREVRLRLADQEEASALPGPVELVALGGTLSPDGPHLHVAVSDSTGRTVGGHLVPGCLVYTTAEIVVGEAEALELGRPRDPSTGYGELEVRARPVR